VNSFSLHSYYGLQCEQKNVEKIIGFSLTEEALHTSVSKLKPGNDYKISMQQQNAVVNRIDVGLNATRTSRSVWKRKDIVSVGRVQTLFYL